MHMYHIFRPWFGQQFGYEKDAGAVSDAPISYYKLLLLTLKYLKDILFCFKFSFSISRPGSIFVGTPS